MATRSYGFILFLPLLLLYSPIRNADCQSLDDLVKTYGDALTNGSDSSPSAGLRSGLALIAHPEKAKCLQKLAPCKEFIHFEGKPPATCCDPIAELVGNDTEECLCIFNSEDLLHTANLTKEEAVSMATMCGSKLDLSSCPADSASAPSGSGTSTENISLPPISLDSASATASDTKSTSDEPKESSGATTSGKISHLKGFGLTIVTTTTTLMCLNTLTPQ